MQTHSVQSSKEQSPVYRWLPLTYLLLFGGLFLLCLWAEVSRRQRIAKPQTTRSCVRNNPVSTTVTGYSLIQLVSKTNKLVKRNEETHFQAV
jgi:hypothetical protein